MVKYNTIFYKNGVIFHACVHGRWKDFSQDATGRFFQKFFYGGGRKVVKFAFCHSKPRKQPFLPKFSNSCPPSDTHACAGKSSCHTIKNWCNFERFNTILNSEIVLYLIRKMKYLTDQFQWCFCFCIGNTK